MSRPHPAAPRRLARLVALSVLCAVTCAGRAYASDPTNTPATPSTVTAPPADSPPASPAADEGAEAAAAAGPDTITASAQQASEIEELKRRVDVLASEVEQLRSGEEQQVELTPERRQALGLAPSAAATYRKKQGVSIAGYGEMLYENPDAHNQSGARGGASQLDFLRAILYTGYRFSDRFLFNSEIEFEHANEVSVEFAYLDAILNDRATLRGGMVLVPLGLVNEFHEPTVFIGARRPETELRIIPSTWRENGFGVLGSVHRVNYRAFLVSGLNAGGFGPEGLRAGRQEGSRSRTADVAFAARVDVAAANGVLVGGAVYTGGADQDQVLLNGQTVDVSTTIGELHGQALVRGFDLRALFARATVDHALELNRARGLASNRGVAEGMQGGYVQVGYNVLSQFTPTLTLTPYYRFEGIDTQRDLPAGYTKDLSRDGRFHTVGAEFRPLYNIVVKADYQVTRNEAKTGRNQFNINLGYAF